MCVAMKHLFFFTVVCCFALLHLSLCQELQCGGLDVENAGAPQSGTSIVAAILLLNFIGVTRVEGCCWGSVRWVYIPNPRSSLAQLGDRNRSEGMCSRRQKLRWKLLVFITFKCTVSVWITIGHELWHCSVNWYLCANEAVLKEGKFFVSTTACCPWRVKGLLKHQKAPLPSAYATDAVHAFILHWHQH